MKPGQCITAIDRRYFRPAEVETLLGDPRKAREKLGWSARFDLQRMCEDSWRWQSSNPNGFEG